MSILYPKPILCNALRIRIRINQNIRFAWSYICAIRDNITTCDIASITDIIAMIEDICNNE